MKVLYCGVRFENYDSKRRTSFEYNNFYLTLKHMFGVEVIEYPFDEILTVGKKKFNEGLLELVKKENPDILFVFMYTDELDPETLTRIKSLGNTKTVAWFADDYWRFFNYSKHWPQYFDNVVTTYSKAAEWYRQAGFTNILLSQWACNTAAYKPVEVKKDINVSFVGQLKAGRVRAVRALERAGIKVECFGFGWPNGKVSQEEMLRVFGRSRINLNLTDRQNLLSPSVLARLFLKKSVNRIIPDFHIIDNIRAYMHFPIPHTHARPFELAGCRAFVLSGHSEDVGRYYKEGEEIALYKSIDELVEKVCYYLPKEKKREAIAERAYERTMREHTYEKRFNEIFSKIGLKKNKP